MEAAPPSCLLGNELQTLPWLFSSEPLPLWLLPSPLHFFRYVLVMCVVEVLVNRN
jgi:hypothetical protein